MLGYAIASNKNAIVFLDGDGDFKQHLQFLIQNQMRPAEEENASTSSGIFIEPGERTRKVSKRIRKKSTFAFSENEVSHVLLPLISFYRAVLEATNDAVNSICAENGAIVFKRLSNDFLILCFGENTLRRNELIDTIELALDTMFGPLFNLCNLELLSLKSARENMSLLFQRFSKRSYKELMNVRTSAYYYSQIVQVLPLLQNISSQLQIFLGSNRCLLTSKGEVLASMSSKCDGHYLLSELSAKDFQWSFDQMNAPTAIMQGVVSQFWLRSFDGVIPYYVNAIQCRLTEHILLVCLCESRQNDLIRFFCLFLKQLEQIRNSTDICKDTKEISRTVADLQRMLLNKKPFTQNGLTGPSYMKNPIVAAGFLETIWERVKMEIEKQYGIPEKKARSNSRLSIVSLRSAFSTLSLNSSATMTPSTSFSRVRLPETTYTTFGAQNYSAKFEVLLAYAKRQVVSIIQELCEMSSIGATAQDLPLFQQTITKIIRGNHRIHLQALAIGDKNTETNLCKFLVPVELRLDMLAYTFVINHKQIILYHMPEDLKIDIGPLKIMEKCGDFSRQLTGKSGAEYTLYHIRVPYSNYKEVSIIQRLIRGNAGGRTFLTGDVTLSVVFPAIANEFLAVKQMNRLLQVLSEAANNVYGFYC